MGKNKYLREDQRLLVDGLLLLKVSEEAILMILVLLPTPTEVWAMINFIIQEYQQGKKITEEALLQEATDIHPLPMT